MKPRADAIGGLLASFRVFPDPERSRLHFRVKVFRSNRAMRAYLSGRDVRGSLGRYGIALCTTWTRESYRGSRRRMCLDMGEITLAHPHLGTEVVAHECTHAAIQWAQRVGLQPLAEKVSTTRAPGRMASADEERFCYGLGQMAAQIARQLWKRELIA
jgi:hypothetical protein